MTGPFSSSSTDGVLARRRPAAWKLLAFAAGYAAAAEVGNRLTLPPRTFSTFWLPSGVFTGALLLLPRAAWPWVVLAALPANLLTNLLHGRPPAASLLFFAGNVAESLAGAGLVRRATGGRSPLGGVRGVLALVGFGAILGPGLAALNGAAVVWLRGGPFGASLLRWWVASAVGALVVAPALLAWLDPAAPRAPPRRRRALEAAGLAALLGGCSWLVLGSHHQAFYTGEILLAPPLVWAALRFDARGFTACGALVSVLSVWATARGLGGFATHGASDAERGLALQLFIGVVLTTGLLLAAAIASQRRAEAEAQEALRLAGVGTLAAGVAHEVNNPLASIMGNLGFLRDQLQARGVALPPDCAEALQEAEQGAARVRDIVRDLRGLARRPVPASAAGPSDAAEALRAAVGMAAHELRTRARLVTRFDPAPRVAADEGRLAQVFLNLIVNAAQAIPAGRPDENEVRVGVGAGAPGEVVVEVEDTGAGMQPEVHARIFEPFFTTKPVGTGTGLGLSICHGIVTGVGGRITVESTPGRGTRVRVVLPAARG